MILIATMIDDVNDREFMYGVYENNKLLMIAIARRYSDNEHDCEDIVHDTVERLCGKVKKLRGFSEYTLKAYIAHSVRNVALNHQRHQAVIARHAEDFAEESYEPETPYTKLERIEDLDEARAKLVAVWDKLPESDRDILYRKYVFEEDYAEIAKELGCAIENVRMRLSRARRRALKLIEDGAENGAP